MSGEARGEAKGIGIFEAVLTVLFVFAIIGTVIWAAYGYFHHTPGCPRGYRIVCDHKGKFGWTNVRSSYVHHEPYWKREDAIKATWDDYAWMNRSHDESDREQERLRETLKECNE